MRRFNLVPCGHYVYVETGTTIMTNLDDSITIQTTMGPVTMAGYCPVCGKPFERFGE